MKKLTYEYVKGKFEEEGYKLLSGGYVGAHFKLDYVCPNGHQHYITWASWQRGTRCSYCAGKIKLTIEFVRKEFEKEGYKLLSKEYKNCSQKLKYICPNNHKHYVSWSHFKQNVRCPKCYYNEKRFSIDNIRFEFEKEGHILLTNEYINNKQKLDYVCPNGHKHWISWHTWQRGQRCLICWNLNRSGSGNPNWKGGISCEPYCFEWSSKEFKDFIKERDDYKCLNPYCCSKNPNDLTIHHIDYNKKNCEPQNLITLCRSCNSRANSERKWHKAWYKAILNKRYGYAI